jgi:hypothetical protein
MRERLRQKSSGDSPLARAVDDATFQRVEADIMKRHSKELGGPPTDEDPKSLSRHLKWWARLHPGGDIDNADPENLTVHLLSYHANRRLLQ